MTFKQKISLSFIVFTCVFFVSCSKEPKPIEYGKDNCDFCQMTISDERYGAELVTSKGRIYKFDDLHCIKEFVNEKTVPNEDIYSTWCTDFTQKHGLIELKNAFLLKNDALKSPMGSNIATFKDKSTINQYFEKQGGTIITWKDYLNIQ